MSSPALTPVIPAPISRCVSLSKISLVVPSDRLLANARPLAAHGKLAFSISILCNLASVSVIPAQATSGSV